MASQKIALVLFIATFMVAHQIESKPSSIETEAEKEARQKKELASIFSSKKPIMQTVVIPAGKPKTNEFGQKAETSITNDKFITIYSFSDAKNALEEYKPALTNLKVSYLSPSGENRNTTIADFNKYLVECCSKSLQSLTLGSLYVFDTFFEESEKTKKKTVFKNVVTLTLTNGELSNKYQLSSIFPNLKSLYIYGTDMNCESLRGLDVLNNLEINEVPGHFFTISPKKGIFTLNKLKDLKVSLINSIIGTSEEKFPISFSNLSKLRIVSKHNVITSECNLIKALLKNKNIQELTVYTKDSILLEDLGDYIKELKVLTKLIGVQVSGKDSEANVVKFENKFPNLEYLVLDLKQLNLKRVKFYEKDYRGGEKVKGFSDEAHVQIQ